MTQQGEHHLFNLLPCVNNTPEWSWLCISFVIIHLSYFDYKWFWQALEGIAFLGLQVIEQPYPLHRLSKISAIPGIHKKPRKSRLPKLGIYFLRPEKDLFFY